MGLPYARAPYVFAPNVLASDVLETGPSRALGATPPRCCAFLLAQSLRKIGQACNLTLGARAGAAKHTAAAIGRGGLSKSAQGVRWLTLLCHVATVGVVVLVVDRCATWQCTRPQLGACSSSYPRPFCPSPLASMDVVGRSCIKYPLVFCITPTHCMPLPPKPFYIFPDHPCCLQWKSHLAVPPIKVNGMNQSQSRSMG